MKYTFLYPKICIVAGQLSYGFEIVEKQLTITDYCVSGMRKSAMINDGTINQS